MARNSLKRKNEQPAPTKRERFLAPLKSITRGKNVVEEPIPIPDSQLSEFIALTEQAYVNKTVALRDSSNQYFFQHSVFESITEKYMKVTSMSTHYSLENLDGGNSAQASSRVLSHLRPVRLESHRNLSSGLLRSGIAAKDRGKDLPTEYLHLKTDKRLHPKIKKIMPSNMNYSVGIPIFVQNQPIGVLWGIRQHRLSKAELKEASNQLNSLAEGISNIIYAEYREKTNAHTAKLSIERIDAQSKLIRVMYSVVDGQSRPLKSVEKYSYEHKQKYTVESNYIIPMHDGYSISIQSFLPEKRNKTAKVILMVPGFFCNRNVMEPMARVLCLKYGYVVYSLDKRGRSELTMPPDKSQANWTIDDYIWYDFPTALKWINDRHKNEKIVVYGHSMGGMVPRFYASSYEQIKEHTNQPDLLDPNEILAGIVSITSPTYVNIKADITGFEAVKWSAKFISRNIFVLLFSKLVSAIANTAIPVLSLPKFFKFWHNLHQDSRKISYAVGTGIPTINDFIGYPEITPPELNFLMDDVFCEESIKVLFQFMRSQFSDKEFLSYDEKLNYSKEVRNITVPIFSILGTIDKIVPPETIRNSWQKIKSPVKEKIEVDQGHLGVLLHKESMMKIASESSEWIEGISGKASLFD